MNTSKYNAGRLVMTEEAYFDDDFGVIGERAARDEDGKTYNVPADMTYEEWEKRFVDGEKTEEVGTDETDEIKPISLSYTPAKSIEEAQEYAERYIEASFMDKTFKGKADFKGISLDHANSINQALTNVFESFPDLDKLSGIKVVSPTSATGKKAFKDGADALFSYDPIQNGIYVNGSVLKDKKALDAYITEADEAWTIVKDNLDKLDGNQRETAERYLNAGRSLVDGKTVEGLFTHELGHHVQWTYLDADTNNSVGKNMSKYAPKISGYATASKSEYLAESFTAYMKGEKNILDPEYVGYLDKKVVAKSSEGGIIKMYRKGDTHRRTSEDGHVIADKATFNKITKPAIRAGADIIIAEADELKFLEKQNATAMTIDNIIILREDASVSEILEEVKHFDQNKRGFNNNYASRERTILNEIDAKEYVISMKSRYNIPQQEIYHLKKQIKSYTDEMNELKRRGEWNEPS